MVFFIIGSSFQTRMWKLKPFFCTVTKFAASPLFMPLVVCIGYYTLSESWSGVNWADLMAAQGAFGTDFYDRSILRPKHRAYYRSGRPVVKIGPKGALGSHEIRPIHSAPSLGQTIDPKFYNKVFLIFYGGLTPKNNLRKKRKSKAVKYDIPPFLHESKWRGRVDSYLNWLNWFFLYLTYF